MSDSCTPTTGEPNRCAVPDQETKREDVTYCSACGVKGKTVDTQTVKALLAVSLRNLNAGRYRFCQTPECPVVYFATDGQEQYTEAELRQPVHQKHPDADDIPVCYCFNHTPGTIRAELAETGQSTVIAEISTGIQAGQCACEIRNPQGTCCLGNVGALLKHTNYPLPCG